MLLLRDETSGGTGGLEVFLLERHLKSDFAGGAYAFPGGKVDPMDLQLPPERWTGLDPRQVMGRLGARTTDHAVGLLAAAARETFEEAGPLLAHHGDGRPVTAEDLASDSFLEARRRLATRGEHWDWRPWLEAEDLVLDLGALQVFAWWATPHGMHKRFDTRFLAVPLPTVQADALGHDDIETTDSVWRRPSDALAAAERGEVHLPDPPHPAGPGGPRRRRVRDGRTGRRPPHPARDRGGRRRAARPPPRRWAGGVDLSRDRHPGRSHARSSRRRVR